jgi:hypothetical protein
LAFSLFEEDVFLDLGNVLVKWDSDFFTLQKGFLRVR